MSDTSTRSIAVCLACYNRKAATLRCLRNLLSAKLPPFYALEIYLVDDASPDGTADAVRTEFPGVAIYESSGNLFWGGGMRQAISEAMERGHDFYLWLNDDVEILSDAFCRVIETYEQVSSGGRTPAIVLAATCDQDGKTTYSGMRRMGFNPLGFRRVEPDRERPVRCDTMNGNFVLVPARIANVVGNIDARFKHRIGDIDYGLRVCRAGFEVWLAPGYAGFCPANTSAGVWASANYSFRQRWQHVRSPLGAPFWEWIVFGYRHGGILGLGSVLMQYRWLFFPFRRD
ncbi:MAG: glycosyltransferase family 2 protein [Rhizomicrobium sp.]